jgi:hypothetical protein
MKMTVTWTSGYCEAEARPLVAWKWEDDADWKTSLASTVTYKKSDMCGKLPVKGFIGCHSFLSRRCFFYSEFSVIPHNTEPMYPT